MSYTVDYTTLDGYVLGVYKGKITASDIVPLWQKNISKLQELNMKRLLADVRSMETDITMFDSISYTEQILQDGIFPIRFRAAMVYSPSNKEAVLSYEIASVNRSFSIKAFGDMDEAISWLCT